MASKEEVATWVSTISIAWVTVDDGAILGAFAGAVLYTVIVSDSSIKKRLVFMLVSFIAGYLGSPMLENIPTGFMAFLISAGIVAVVLLFHKVINKLDIEHAMELAKRWVDKWKL